MPDDIAPDLSHLHPTVRGSARPPAGERVELIRADRWIGCPKAVETVARLEVGAWIEDRYNRRRRHASLGQITPVAFEMQYSNEIADFQEAA